MQVRDTLGEDFRRLKKIQPEQSTSLSRSVEELFTPLQALDNGRVGSASFRNDGQLELPSPVLLR